MQVAKGGQTLCQGMFARNTSYNEHIQTLLLLKNFHEVDHKIIFKKFGIKNKVLYIIEHRRYKPLDLKNLALKKEIFLQSYNYINC